MNDFAEKAVKRFWMNLLNGIEVLLKEGTITEKTTVKKLLTMCKNRI